MANTKSAKKRIKQNEKARIRNKAIRTHARTVLKQFTHLLTTKSSSNEAELSEQLKHVEQTLDKATSKGVFHKNKTARLKSRVYKKYQAFLSQNEVISTPATPTSKGEEEPVS